MPQWETVIGLEVHVQLSTKSKLFSRTKTSFAAAANSNASIIDLGFPGTLPQLNEAAIRMAIAFGLAVDASIARQTIFARKHYFYPDLPKGFQISQLDAPIVYEGAVDIVDAQGNIKLVGIERAHLEEDAGKSMHDRFEGLSAIDLNRAGTPLIEVVSKPDMRSAQEAVAYLKKIHGIIRSLGISDGNMAEGSMRCDANVSIRLLGSTELGTKVEIKNINSFRFIEKAIEYEVSRQIDSLESGETLQQETRLYNQNTNVTKPMRSKEEANDYRYFPDPDLLPTLVSDALIEQVRSSLPELPEARYKRYLSAFALNESTARILADDIALAHYFEQLIAQGIAVSLAANWMTGSVLATLTKRQCDMQDFPITTEQLAVLLKNIATNSISNTAAKDIFAHLLDAPDTDIESFIVEQGLAQVSDSGTLEAIIDEIIQANPTQVEQYRAASDDKKKRLIGFFVGQTMKASKGTANPQMVQTLLAATL